MATKTLKTVPKISVRIWRPIIDRLDEKMDAACLCRDAYLSKVLENELDWLDHEVSIANSQASYAFVAQQLDSLNRKLVSLALPSGLTARLKDICDRKRIVRDAFFNRLFLLLAASPGVIDALLFDQVANEWRREVWREHKHEGPFFLGGFYPLEPTVDPFWAIRSGLELYADAGGIEDYVEPLSGETIRVQRDLAGGIAPADSVYTIVFDRRVQEVDLLGMSCYLPDWRIPGHGPAVAHQAKLDELLASLQGSGRHFETMTMRRPVGSTARGTREQSGPPT